LPTECISIGTDSSVASPVLTGTGGNAGPLDCAFCDEPQPANAKKISTTVAARMFMYLED